MGRVSPSCPNAECCTGPYTGAGVQETPSVNVCLGSWEVMND